MVCYTSDAPNPANIHLSNALSLHPDLAQCEHEQHSSPLSHYTLLPRTLASERKQDGVVANQK
jgi:hypothetical protein